MADVVRQRQRFGQIFIQPEYPSHRARDLRNLDGMRQAVAEMIGKVGGENLRLVFQPPESPRMHDAVAIALKFVAVGMGKFGIAAPARPFDRKAKLGERDRPHYLFEGGCT